MDFEVGGISGFSQDVAGDDRPVCHLVESRLFTIFFALPRSEGLRYGCFSSELGWLSGVGYAFPPWSLIPLVLKKLRLSCGVLMTLITPLWPQRPWYSDLLDLVVDGPVLLLESPDLLRQPHFHCHHLGIHRLSLHAW